MFTPKQWTPIMLEEETPHRHTKTQLIALCHGKMSPLMGRLDSGRGSEVDDVQGTAVTP